ncbi:MAG: putative toxin-antitoxin system toxin component, PIN family [Bryobacteraceae bacterium]
MRVLLDVNILVRANEKSHGLARKLLHELIAQKKIALASTEILIELGRVLRYPRLHALFGLSEEKIYEYVQFLKEVCQIVPIDLNWNFPIRDPSDTAILRTAVAGEADYICTLDKDFYAAEVKAFCATVGITVLDDVSLMHRLRS